MNKLIECVPNFSEGRNQNKIDDIVQHMSTISGITVLDVDPGPDTNRTVVTIVGSPDAVGEAAFQGIKRASEILDMSQHSGTHPRMGATDVCPFIPISGVTDEECIALSKQVGKRVGDELGIPVYIYEKSAQKSERIKLPVIRKGEYEGLTEKLKDKNWKPDYGPADLHIKAGATVMGCREFLIAYNINLNTKDHRLATDIAFELRETGRSKRIPNQNSKNLLDGDIVRTHLSSELGFSKEHRSLNVQRIGFVASEITKNGGIAICAPIAPYTADRRVNRELINPLGGYIEIFVSTSLEKCEERDVKGLYALARKGVLKEFTGISDPYEAPEDAEIVVNSTGISPEVLVEDIFNQIKELGYL